MVSDVQGVGLYFTDPAVNTKNGIVFLIIPLNQVLMMKQIWEQTVNQCLWWLILVSNVWARLSWNF